MPDRWVFENLLIESIKERLISDVPVGSFLSGGYDSSLISGILSKKLNKKISTFTIGFNNKEYDESKHAKKIANYLGTCHHELILEKGFKAKNSSYFTLGLRIVKGEYFLA